ncbi:thioredoxin family protein [Marinilongibacter aquaticus]|uniref:thioredoxin domain-containing protein n=1 Tax=Marinilongibacter aquaticus TaxID=2975157 RepID=UPI0021BD0DB9|nr:thioredoxin domain-containing protein [Marinilongibacter aquaticus]UBM59677.1 thioredoxin family protein [Marinilongibacter aquaticus]
MKKLLLIFGLVLLFTASHAQSRWTHSYEQARAMSLLEHKLILVDFTASWCGPCRKMEVLVWPRAQIKTLSEKFILLKVDIDANPDLAQKYDVKSIPRVVLIDVAESPLEERVGYQNELAMFQLMTEYPGNVKIINDALMPLLQDKKNFIAHYNTGVAYGRYLNALKGDAKKNFYRIGEEHLELAQKHAKKNKSVRYIEKSILEQALNLARTDTHDKVVKSIEDYGYDKFMPENKSYMYFILGYSAKRSGLSEELAMYKDKLDKEPGGAHFMNILDKID